MFIIIITIRMETVNAQSQICFNFCNWRLNSRALKVNFYEKPFQWIWFYVKWMSRAYTAAWKLFSIENKQCKLIWIERKTTLWIIFNKIKHLK